jgi:enoyl-CoA hydratase/carnithine racemase
MAYKFIVYEKTDHVVLLTLNRPEKLNAIHLPMQMELWEALIHFRKDPDAWVVVITGAGDRAFCAGMDLKWRSEHAAEATPWGTHYKSDPDRVGPVGSLPTEIWKPMIAAVRGYAVGGGMEITLHCDVVIASEDAKFGVPEIRNVGGFPGGGGIYRLPRQVPYKIAMWMLLSGQFMTAEYMRSIGYVNEVVTPAELITTAGRYARLLCENPPIGVQAAKEIALRGLDLPLDYPPTAWQYQWEGIAARMRNSEDAEESRRAWLERRRPVFRNR